MHPVTPAGALVGRDSEMTLLTGLVREVARGRGSSVLIEGEPGIGKSALVRAATVAASEAGCEVFWGAGDELGQALPLLPFLDGLRVREPSANPRRNTIVQLLRGEVTADRGMDVPAVLAEQLLALVTEHALSSRSSWSSTTCNRPTRPASPCGGGWPARRRRYRGCWPERWALP